MRKFALSCLIVLLIGLTASAAFAQSTLGFNGIGGRVGLVDPEDIDATIGVDFVIDFGLITANVPLEIYSGFWSKTENLGSFGDQTVRDFIFGSRAKYVFIVANPSIHPFVGGGMSLHIVKFDTPAFDIGPVEFPAAEDTELKIGLDVGGGLGIDLSDSAMLTGELYYGVVSDVSHLALKIGVLFWLN